LAPVDLRLDLKLIADMITPGSRVLDIGCGDGALLDYLAQNKEVDGRGIEISQDGVNACVAHGLSVIQGDADTDLTNYPDHAFDYVVLGQTLQATRQPKQVLEDLVRIGRHAVVSFINFGYWRTRLSLLVQGRVPVKTGSSFSWYDSPDIHLCTILDFV
jgi:methionine biosynthesis protein MetW